MFKIFKTEEFDKIYYKLDNNEQKRITKILFQLLEKGDVIGKPLAGLNFFREKKFNGKRLYYLIYKDFNVILVIAISDKKAQQATINKILFNLDIYKESIIKTLKDRDVI